MTGGWVACFRTGVRGRRRRCQHDIQRDPPLPLSLKTISTNNKTRSNAGDDVTYTTCAYRTIIVVGESSAIQLPSNFVVTHGVHGNVGEAASVFPPFFRGRKSGPLLYEHDSLTLYQRLITITSTTYNIIVYCLMRDYVSQAAGYPAAVQYAT